MDLAGQSDDIQEFVVTVPAGTPQAAPVTLATAMPPRVVNKVTVDIPFGSAGQMGWRITDKSGNPVIPSNGTFVVMHSGQRDYQIVDGPTGGDWAVQAFNTGLFNHTIKVLYHLAALNKDRSPRFKALIPDSALSSAPDLSQAGPPVDEANAAAMARFRQMTAQWAALNIQRSLQGR